MDKDQAAAEPTSAIDPAKERMQKDAEKYVGTAMKWLVVLGNWLTISLKIVVIIIMMFREISIQAYRGLCIVYTFPETRPIMKEVFYELVEHLIEVAKIDMRKVYYGRDDIDDGHLKLEKLEQELRLMDVGIETRASLVSLMKAVVNWLLKRLGKQQPTDPNSDSGEQKNEQPPATAVSSSATLNVSDSTQQLSALDSKTEVPSSSLM